MKAALYCRLSEEDRDKANKTDDSISIQNQKSMLIQYADEKGWEIYDIYSDDNYTGADRNRPAFRRLLADAKARKFEILLCKTQSRFTRELELVEKYIHGLFPVWGIRFVSIVDNADSDNKGNKKTRQINGLVNEWYLEDMSDNIRSVLDSRRENGFHIGSFAPYGYQKDPDLKGHLIIDEEAAEIVREIFRLFDDGYGKSAIARLLNEKGVPNPTEYKRKKGLRYTSSTRAASPLWKYHSVRSILSNEVYIGNLVQGKLGSISYKTKQLASRPKDQWIRVEGTHDPIIDMELWTNVQKKISTRHRANVQTGKVHLFTGVAVCAHCGYSLRNHKSHDRHYLQCESKYISADVCPGVFLPEAKLEQIVIGELRKLNQSLLDQQKLERQVKFEAIQNEKKKTLLFDQKRYQARLDECNGAMQQIYSDKTMGLISPKDFLELSKGFRDDRERYEGLLHASRLKIQEMEDGISKADRKKALLDPYIHVNHLTRSMVETLIERIEVGKRDRQTRIIPVTLYWKF